MAIWRNPKNSQSPKRESLNEREKVEGQLHELEGGSVKELDITGQMLIQSQKLAGLGELVASIGHDIGNPLHSLQMGLETRNKREKNIFEAVESILDDSDEAQAFVLTLNRSLKPYARKRNSTDVWSGSMLFRWRCVEVHAWTPR